MACSSQGGIQFNPDRSLNCQAEAAATFASLVELGLTESIKDFDSYLDLLAPRRKHRRGGRGKGSGGPKAPRV